MSVPGVGLREEGAGTTEREWSVLFATGVRTFCVSESDARRVAGDSSGVAQWRTGWLDVDVFEVHFLRDDLVIERGGGTGGSFGV